MPHPCVPVPVACICRSSRYMRGSDNLYGTFALPGALSFYAALQVAERTY
jgi:hypothetical protein